MSPMNHRLLVPRKTPGLLDLVPGAAAAYSLRSLSRSYAGPVVTVRRSSDNAEDSFTASEVADGTLAAFCGAGDGFVKQWWDQSGNARHASQSTAASQPKIVDSGAVVTKEGKPALDFDGTDDRLSSSLTNLSTPFSLATVFTLNALGSNRTVFGDWNSSASDWYMHYNVSLNGIVFVDDVHSTSPDAVDEIAVGEQAMFFVFDGSPNIKQSKNGAVSTSNAASNGVSLDGGNGLDIGSLGTALQFADMLIQELVIWDADKLAQREQIEAQIAWGYSV